jgi:hypothetical protein
MSYSKYTIKSYEQSLQSLRRLYLREKKVEMSSTLCELANVDEIMRLLEAEYPPQTVINFISAVLWYTQCTELREAYQAHGARLKQSIEQSKAGKEHELTFKEQQSFMIWEDILRVSSELLKGLDKTSYNHFMDFVIVSLYTLHPPARADYANMRLFIEDSLIPPDFTDNYCVLQTDPRFVFQQYKTAKHKGTTVVPMDETLHAILLDWASIHPSPFLLALYHGPTQSYRALSENALSKRITSIFLKYAARPVTINTLRHSFISYMSKCDQLLDNKRANATRMMHSMTMADKYRRLVYLS